MEANLRLMEQLIESRTADMRRAADASRRVIVSRSNHTPLKAVGWRLGELLIRAGQRLSGPDAPVGAALQPRLHRPA